MNTHIPSQERVYDFLLKAKIGVFLLVFAFLKAHSLGYAAENGKK
jgi:hypothetical protein